MNDLLLPADSIANHVKEVLITDQT